MKNKFLLLILWSSLFSCAQQQKAPKSATALPNAIEEKRFWKEQDLLKLMFGEDTKFTMLKL